MVIAIDGPAGTGKSTIASLLAKKLGITFLNSGSFYRALTLALLKNGIDLNDEAAVVDFCKKQKLDYVDSHLILNGDDVESLLHSDEVSAHAAGVSAFPEVRRIVNDRLRELTKSLDIVSEGRDMTTVVFPDADCKFYLDASLDVQAERRFKQGVSGMTLEEIKEAIKKRDEIDKNKKEGALVVAPDAVYIDTSTLTIEKVCEIILNQIHEKGSKMETQEVEKEQNRDSKDKFQTQLEESLNSLSTPENGQLVDGTVVAVTDDTVFVDVNCKSEGRIPKSEFGSKAPEVGDTVTVKLVNKFGKNGPEISKRQADEKRLWKDITQAFKDKIPIDGTVAKVVKGGFEVDLGGGIHAFLPISQSDSQKVEKPESLVGTESK
ncbi:MAG: (d)CMP kinase, partial [Treponema socranskii subsp. buccale]